MADSNWDGYSKDTLDSIQKNQNWCNEILRDASLTKSEKQIVERIDITNENIKVVHEFASHVARTLSRVDNDLINLKSQLMALNSSVGDLCKRVEKLENK